MPTKVPQNQTIERKIFFYKIRPDPQVEGPEFNSHTVFNHIKALPFSPDGRYLDIGEGNVFCVWPDADNPKVKTRIGIVRRSGLPEVERAGNLTPLAIPDDAGLLETVHLEFFAHKIVGAEFNFHGPRISRLSDYISERCDGITHPVFFDLLVRHDVAEQLKVMGDIRLVQLKMHRSQLDILKEADESLFAMFRSAEEASGADTIEITLNHESYSEVPLQKRVAEWVRKLAKHTKIHEAADSFKVKALNTKSGHFELFDLLKDQLVATKQVVKQDTRSRVVKSSSMYNAIESAYGQLEGELKTAATIENVAY